MPTFPSPFRSRFPRSPRALIAAACILLPWTARSAPSEDTAAAPAGLDTGALHAEYLDGNFENVIARLEAYREERPSHSREDSLFIARHLAVVYAADPKSIEVGKYWMHRLVVLAPAADLAGMYASESIERTFEKVKAETLARFHAGIRSRRRWLWIGAGGTALAAATVVAIIATRPEDPRRVLVPVDL